jgi:hypothetical protein
MTTPIFPALGIPVIVSFVVSLYIGLRLVRSRLRGRYLVVISLMYWMVALVVSYLSLSVLWINNPIYMLFLLSGSIGFDAAFFIGYYPYRARHE